MVDDDAAERAKRGAEHLQAAAQELIAAGRALLDVAEELVADPAAVRDAITALGSLARAGTDRRSQPAPGDEPDEPKVQRIKVS